MTRLNPGKLLHTKWTAMQPRAGEKHFIVIQVGGKKSKHHRQVTLQAALTGHTYTLDWRDLTDDQHWRRGWHQIDTGSPRPKHQLPAANDRRGVDLMDSSLPPVLSFHAVSKSYDADRCVGGVLLASVLIYIINRSYFGWTIQPYFAWESMAQQAAIILGAALLASLYPAFRASQTPASELSRDDL